LSGRGKRRVPAAALRLRGEIDALTCFEEREFKIISF
jgi:hypothetical protein